METTHSLAEQMMQPNAHHTTLCAKLASPSSAARDSVSRDLAAEQVVGEGAVFRLNCLSCEQWYQVLMQLSHVPT